MVNPKGKQERHFEIHEVALLILGSGTSLALFAASPKSPVLLTVAAGTIIYGTLLYICRRSNSKRRFDQRIPFMVSFVFASWFYWSVESITPALRKRSYDKVLLGLDRAIFGHTPATWFERIATNWLSDLMSVCYLTYHLYLAIVIIHVLRDPKFLNRGLPRYLFMGFALGFTGYLLVPAVGPVRAFPELFGGPLPGGIISRAVTRIVDKGSSVYDLFPSLHVLITCILLDYDWREMRKRFWIMVAPALGLIVSTIYLRYHYGVDILAGAILFLALRQTIFKPEEATALGL